MTWQRMATTLVSTALTVGLTWAVVTKNHEGAGNLLTFLVWSYFAIAVFVASVSMVPKAPPLLPPGSLAQRIGSIGDIGCVVALAWHGWFATAAALLVAWMLFNAIRHSEAKRS